VDTPDPRDCRRARGGRARGISVIGAAAADRRLGRGGKRLDRHAPARHAQINQSTNQAIINWNTFSVGAGGTVNFNQPGASSATLNRVTSSTPSSIAGTINAPGTVMLVNPNGIAITKSGVINTGSFVASTLGIKNEDFLAGRYNFQGNGASAPVTNRGHINVSTGGFVALLGGRVSNSGVINAKLGKVALGSGEAATIDLSGDGFISVAVPSNQVHNLRGGQGRALVSNKGKINANGGTVYLSAATAKNALQQAVNVPGSISANSVGVRGGKIVLNGGDGGIVNVGGTLAANGGRGATAGPSPSRARKSRSRAKSPRTDKKAARSQ
jgi:filamentous hemagglutinin family protein